MAINQETEKSFQKTITITGHTAPIVCLTTFSTKEKEDLLVSGSEDSTIKIWNPNKQCIHAIKVLSTPQTIIQYKQYLVVGLVDGTVSIHSLEGVIVRILIKKEIIAKGAIRLCNLWNEWIAVVTLSSCSKIQLMDEKKKLHKTLSKFEYPVTSMLTVEDMLWSAAGQIIVVWSRTGEFKRSLPGHQDTVRSLSLMNGDRVISADAKSVIIIWDAHGKQLEKITSLGQSDVARRQCKDSLWSALQYRFFILCRGDFAMHPLKRSKSNKDNWEEHPGFRDSYILCSVVWNYHLWCGAERDIEMWQGKSRVNRRVFIRPEYLPWSVVRLLLLALYKNQANEKCYLSKVPRDVLKLIISEI